MIRTCNAFKNHLMYGIDGYIKPCCVFDTSVSPEYKIQATPDQLNYNTELWHRASQTDFRDIPGCHKCVNDNHMIDFYDRIMTGGDDLEFIELAVSNECNLACRMCFPLCSTKIYQEVEQQGGNIGKFVSNQQVKKSQVTALDIINNVNLKSIKRIKIVGGEPFVSPQTFKLFDILEPYANNIHLQITTNCTFFPKKYLKILSKFKRLVVLLSIDGVEKTAEYIRYGCEWNTVLEVLKQWSNTDFQKRITTSVQAYNMHQLPEIYQLAAEHHIPFSYHMVYNPSYLSVWSMPTDYMQKCVNIIQNSDMQEKDKKTLIQIFRSKPNNQEFTEFKEYTALMDNIRNQNIENILDFD